MKLALIGVGLIGGSAVLAWRAAGLVTHVAGFDVNAESLQIALKRGVIDRAASSASDCVNGADLVLLAVPVGAVSSVLGEIKAGLSDAAIVTDVGSVKANVVNAARLALGPAFGRFVPGHPIAGSELAGVEHADADLFRERLYVSTATAATQMGALEQVEALWRAIGCRIERIDADEHDRIFAAVSHLPHLLAFALIASIAREPDAETKLSHAGTGFRDFTRIAAADPAMWRDICIANREALSCELSIYRDSLAEVQRQLDAADGPALESLFTVARNERLRYDDS